MLGSNRTVWVTHSESRKDTTSALDYGSLEEVLRQDENPMPHNIPDITAKIEQRLANATEDDFLLLMGSPIAIAICAGVMARRFGRINLLKHNGRLGRYFPAIVTLDKEG